ncbi:MAG: hypothetical protein ABIO61_10590 [Thermomonas sp.]
MTDTHKHPLMTRPAIATGLILMIPLLMTYLDRNLAEGDGWRWSPMDFVLLGALLFGAGMAFEYVASRTTQKRHKLLAGIAIFSVVVLIWVELAVDGVSQLLHVMIG